MHATNRTAIDAAGADLVGDTPALVGRQGHTDGLPIDDLALFQSSACDRDRLVIGSDAGELINGFERFGHAVLDLQQAHSMAEEAAGLAGVVDRGKEVGELQHQIGALSARSDRQGR